MIPEFLYKELYDSKHRGIAVLEEWGKSPRKYVFQRGMRERLLCRSCELRISIWEKYTKEEFLSDKNHGASIVGPDPTNKGRVREYIRMYKGLDYRTLKLFALSLLWRASVSSLEFFSQVSIAPKHEWRIRQMMLGHQTLGAEDYPLFISEDYSSYLRQVLPPPNYVRVDGCRAYHVAVANQIWCLVVSSHSPSEGLMQRALKEDGTLRVFKFDFTKTDFAKGFYGRARTWPKGILPT